MISTPIRTVPNVSVIGMPDRCEMPKLDCPSSFKLASYASPKMSPRGSTSHLRMTIFDTEVPKFCPRSR